jgi:quercetin dioxygenase-like cupin family protein
MTVTDESPFLVAAGTGRTLLDGPLGAVLLAGSDETAGRVAFVLHPLAPRALGSPLHTHTREDEWTFVLEGEVGVEIGGETLVARPGDLVLKPRGVPHAFWNAGDAPARMLEVITPSGFEHYFEGLAEVYAATVPDLEALGRLAARYDLAVDRASVPRLVEAHGLTPR